MRGLALAISSVGVVVGALAVSAGMRRPTAVRLGRARIAPEGPPLPRLRALHSDVPPPPSAAAIPAHVIAPPDSIPAHVIDLKPAPVKALVDMPQRSPKQAAGDLYAYVTQMVRDGRGDELGTVANPNANVLSAQMAMRGVRSDGIYGNSTRARGKELLGREFPSREPKRRAAPPPIVDVEHEASPASSPAPRPPPPPPPPDQHVAEHSPLEAANALHAYINSPHADLGSKERPNELIRGPQHDMGQLKADGIFGPKTRTRMNAILKGAKHG